MRFAVDGEGDHEVTCLKCGHDFVATLEADDPPAKSKKAKPGSGTKERLRAESTKPDRATKRARRDDEDDEDDAPRKKKKKGGSDGGQQKLIIAGAVAGVLLLGGLGALIFALTGSNKVAKNDAPAEVKPQPTNGPGPVPNPGPGINPPKPGPGPNTNVPPGPNVNPPKKNNPQEPPLPPLPPPPKVRPTGGKLTTTTALVKAPPVPPLAPDEDPFVRAKTFKPDGPLPVPPALPKGTQRPLLTLDSGGHTGFVGKVFFDTKSDQIITVGEDKAIRFWDPTTNETVKTVRFPAGPGHEGSLQAAAMSRSGKRLAVAGEPLAKDKKGEVPIYIVAPDTGALVKRLNVGSAAVTGLSFSNDGNWLGVGCENGAIQMVNVSTGVSYPAPPISNARVMEVKYNPNPKAKLLATLGADHFVQIWNFAATAQHKDFPIQKTTPSTLAWSNDGQTLAVGTTTGEIMLGSANGQFQKSLAIITHGGKPVNIRQLQFMPNDREIAVAGASPGIGGWTGIVSADSGVPRVGVTAHSNVVFALDVSADGSQVVSSGGNQHETLIWKADDAKIEHRLAGTGNGVWAIAWAKDGKSIAWGNSNKKDEGVLALESTFRLDEFGVGNPPDPSKYTQTVESDDAGVKLRTEKSVFMVQTAGRDPVLVTLPGHEPIYSATILPKGNAVLVGGVRNLYMVNPANLGIMGNFIGHSGNVLCVTPSPDSKYFATGSSDQTIRIWQRNREEPILSIFIAGREWIAWTPEGYYACSGQGERLIAWQIQAAGVKIPQVHPAERFRSSMYQPALLKYLIPAGNLQAAMAMAQKFDKALVQTTNVADVLPPEVALDGFTETEVKIDKGSFTVKAQATSAKHPITAMRLLVNGRPFNGAAGVKRFENAQPNTPADATWEVPLAPGTHTVAVIADSPVSKGMSKVGVVIRSGEIPKPNLYVLAMGVSDYPGKLKLRYCATDAEMLAAAFKEKSKGVFAKIEVKLLTDKDATKKGIRDGLDWMKSKMTPQDVGVVSFSGHGMRDDFNRFYLVPFDVQPDDFEGTSCLPGDEFKSRLDNMPGRLVAILDACHSGSVAEKERAPAQADTLVRDLTAEDSGVIVMCASLGREYAIESPISKAGFFTLGLVEGMSGYGDIDEDGVVYIHELDMYATARVRQLSGGSQNPTLGRPSAVRPFAIAKPENPLRAEDPKPAPAPSKPPAPSTPPASTNPSAPGTPTGPATPGSPNKPPPPFKPPVSDKSLTP